MMPINSFNRFFPVFRSPFAALVLAVPSAPAQQLSDARNVSDLMPSEGVLLLSNGETIQGKISRVGDWYYVVVEGGEIRIRPDRVEFHCRSLEEGYWKKRRLIRADDILERIRLARWCIRHDLFKLAEEEFEAAALIDERHPMLPLMRRQLEMAQSSPEPSETPSAETDEQERGPTPAELDSLVRTLPPKTMEMFTKTVQPLLVNRCSNGACHGPRSEEKPRFYRFRTGTLPSRRTTQRNLHAVMDFVDRKNPAASPLLTVPLRSHGDTSPLFAEGGPQAVILEAWLRSVAAGGHGDVEPTLRPSRAQKPHRPPIHALTPPGGRPPFPDALEPKNGESGSFGKAERQIAAPWVANSEAVRDNRPKSRGRFTPRDPFDPEIFNRLAK
jgi:hypothetical protein